jgi:hypothetical protein
VGVVAAVVESLVDAAARVVMAMFALFALKGGYYVWV